MDIAVPEYILDIAPYKPGKPIEELEREYGIAGSIKLASNENPLGPSPLAVEAINDVLHNLHRYPDGRGFTLIDKIRSKFGVSARNIILGNGSDEIIGLLARTLLTPGDVVILPQPSFLMYDIMVKSVGAVPCYVPLKKLAIDLESIRDRVTLQTKMIFLCNPNNPTGMILHERELSDFLNALPASVVVVIDEAYIEFVRDPDCAKGLDYLDSGKAVVTLRTFSKAYGLAGLRIGYGIMPIEVAELLNRIRPPFNASLPAQAGAAAALGDDAFLKKTLSLIHAGIDELQTALDRLGVAYFSTQANFFMIDTKKDADTVFEDMLRKGVIVRSMASYGFENYIRINAGRHEENRRFIEVLEDVL